MEGIIILMNYCKRLVGGGKGDWYLKHTSACWDLGPQKSTKSWFSASFSVFCRQFSGLGGKKKYKNERITAKEGEEKEVSLREGASACSRNTTTFFFNVFNIFSFSFCEFRGKKVKRTLFPCLLLVKVLLLFVSAIYSID